MAKRIMVLAGLGTLLSGYYIFFNGRDDLIYLFGVSLVALVIAYTFQHQINSLAIRGVPQHLDPPMRELLLRTTPYFANMPEPQQRMVEDRMVRWVARKEFINKNQQDAPEDVKYILAWYAILLTMHQASYLYKEIDRIVFYHHPFLSPGYQDDAHIAEVETKDGTLIISVPHLLRGHMEKGVYNIGLHAMAVAYARCYMRQNIQWPEDIWEQLEAISAIRKEKIDAYIGLPVSDPWPVAVHHQLTYKDALIPEVIQQFPFLISR